MFERAAPVAIRFRMWRVPIDPQPITAQLMFTGIGMSIPRELCRGDADALDPDVYVSREYAPLAVRLALPEGAASVEVPAQLAYVDGQGDAPEQVGLAFPSLPTGARARLEHFLTAA